MVVDVRCGSGSKGDPGDGDGGLGGGLDGGLECELMGVALRRKAQVDHQTATWAAEFESSLAWTESGAVSAQAWMMFHCHLSRAESGRFLRWGRALRDLPLLDAAFAEGRVTGAHVEVLVALDHGATKEPLHRQEQLLVDLALTQTFDDFTKCVAYWRRHNDPDGTTEEAEERRNRRDVQLSKTLDGMFLGRMVLDPVSGTIIANELERLTQLLFEADWAEATKRLGRTPLACELSRTPSQRRADALLMMARRSDSRTPGSTKPSPLFFVHMDWATMQRGLSELEDGTPLPAAEILSWLEGADIVRVEEPPEGPMTVSYATKVREVTLPCIEKLLADTPNRQECSPFDRVFTGATRRAIEIRTDSAPTLTATDRPGGARSTTSDPGARVASPPRRTAGCSAVSTTAGTTSGSSDPGPDRPEPPFPRPDPHP